MVLLNLVAPVAKTSQKTFKENKCSCKTCPAVRLRIDEIKPCSTESYVRSEPDKTVLTVYCCQVTDDSDLPW